MHCVSWSTTYSMNQYSVFSCDKHTILYKCVTHSISSPFPTFNQRFYLSVLDTNITKYCLGTFAGFLKNNKKQKIKRKKELVGYWSIAREFLFLQVARLRFLSLRIYLRCYSKIRKFIAIIHDINDNIEQNQVWNRLYPTFASPEKHKWLIPFPIQMSTELT